MSYLIIYNSYRMTFKFKDYIIHIIQITFIIIIVYTLHQLK